MPNRIVRDGILTSEAVCGMGPLAQLFYRCLHSVADDFGRYYAKPSLLLSHCFPLRPSWATEESIAEWITECESAGLINTYCSHGTNYLEIKKFGQRIRPGSKSRFPPISESGGNQPLYAADYRESPESAEESGSRAASPPTTPSSTTTTTTPPAAKEKPDPYLVDFTAAICRLGFGNPDGNVETAYFTAKVAEACENAGATPELGAFVSANLLKNPRFRGKPLEYLTGALRRELETRGPNSKALNKADFRVVAGI